MAHLKRKPPARRRRAAVCTKLLGLTPNEVRALAGLETLPELDTPREQLERQRLKLEPDEQAWNADA